jgi:rhodanese-related sulfurtransferase
MVIDFSSGKKVTSEEVSNNLHDYSKECLILDVREPGEFRGGHIPGAVNIPLEQLPNRISELDKKKKVLAVCLSGGRASKAAVLLESRGYKVKSMVEGMSKWQGPLDH